jgi:hypothetical protein
MSRTKKPSKLSADERAFLDRIRSLNEEETEKLTVEEIIAYLNIMDKIDPAAAIWFGARLDQAALYRVGTSAFSQRSAWQWQ